MKLWTLMVVILTLGMGLSIGGLILGYSRGIWENVARYFLVGILGVIITAITLVLVVVAIWPPYNALSVVLTFAFVFLVIGTLVFVRTTNAEDPQIDVNPNLD